MFPDLPEGSERKLGEPTWPQEVRVVRPVRNQIQFLMQDLDAVLPVDHSAKGGRAIWSLVERLDLSGFNGSIRAVQGGPGRPASDPRLLLVRRRRMGIRHGGWGRQCAKGAIPPVLVASGDHGIGS